MLALMELLVFLGVLLLPIVGSAAYYLRDHARRARALRQQIEAYPLSRVADARDGLVAIEGSALALAPLPDPVGGARLIGWHLRVQAKDAEGKDLNWFTMFEETRVGDFEVVDASGKALVQGHGAVALLRLDDATVQKEPARILAQLAAWRGAPPVLRPARGYRLEVRTLREGEGVFVFGAGRREVAPASEQHGYRELSRRLTVSRPTDRPLVIADRRRKHLLATLDFSADVPGEG